MQTKTKNKKKKKKKKNKLDIQIIWFYKDIDGLVLVTCRLQVKLRPIVKEFTCVNQNNFARNFCKYYSLNSLLGKRIYVSSMSIRHGRVSDQYKTRITQSPF